jgi:hypothetical protein
MSPLRFMAVGFALIVAGLVVPFLMVLRILESGLVLSFSAYFLSLTGLLLALYGTFDYVNSRSRDDQ